MEVLVEQVVLTNFNNRFTSTAYAGGGGGGVLDMSRCNWRNWWNRWRWCRRNHNKLQHLVTAGTNGTSNTGGGGGGRSFWSSQCCYWRFRRSGVVIIRYKYQ
jgi:hypothetical protein